MNYWLAFILLVLIGSLIIETFVSYLNIKSLVPQLPREFDGVFDGDKYAKSQRYTRSTTNFGIVQSCYTTAITIGFLIFGGFNTIDLWARSFGLGQIFTGLIFIGLLLTLSFIAGLPFSIYSTFSLEERFGFNRTTPVTFIVDIIKGILLAVVLGGPILALILWFFITSGPYAWLYCWVGLFLFSLLLQFLAPILIMPLFNKFSPLEDGSLKEIILQYAEQEDFKIQGVYTMDGSKRSSKLNAFFTGFGRFRKIVFYDTLLEKLTEEEIIGVLAHEMGHFKLKHIVKLIIGSAIQTGIMFFVLSLFLENKSLSEAFGMAQISTYSSLVFFGFIYSPVNMLVSVAFNIMSRTHEFEADNYAIRTTAQPEFLINGLKKLSAANLSNLTPHPLFVFLHYSHPPILERIKKMQ